MNRMTIYDRMGNWVGELTDVLSAKWAQKVNALSTLTIETRQQLEKGQRLVWRDDMAVWHEHTVVSSDFEHSSGSSPVMTVYLEDSLNELRGEYIENKRPGVSVKGGVSASVALLSALEDTRWAVGTVTVATMAGLSMYHESSWDAVCDIVDKWGGEIESVIAVNRANGVTQRSLNLLARVGSSSVARRFEWTRDLSSIVRTVDDEDVITACWCWGKGEELDSGAYGRRIGIADVSPDGLGYLHNDDLLPTWGLPDGSGGYRHVFGEFLSTNEDDPEQLMTDGQAYLDSHSEPLVSYSASVLQFGAAGVDLTGVALGDSVQIVDTGFPQPLRLEGRVMAITTDLLNPANPSVTLGNFVPGIDEAFTSVSSTLGSLTNQSANYDVAASASANYLAALITELNDLFSSSGCFATLSTTYGWVFTDRATYEESTRALCISGAGLRIASSKTAGGHTEDDPTSGWNWTTFLTGEGATLSAIVTGVLKAGRIESVDGSNWWDLDTSTLSFSNGRIQSANGSSYWDFTTGEMNLNAGVDLNDIYSQLQLTNDSLTTSITGKASEIAALQNALDELAGSVDSTNGRINDITVYFRESLDPTTGNAVLELGSSASNMTMQLTNEQLSFLEDGAIIAYINGQVLHITNADVEELDLGNYSLTPGSNDNLTLRYLG